MKHPRKALAEIRKAIDEMVIVDGPGLSVLRPSPLKEQLLGCCSVIDAFLPKEGQEVVWENECQLVLHESENGCYKTGEMGLCYPDNYAEIQLCISSTDRSAKHEVFSKLEHVPVRVTIERVPGGRV